MVTGQRVNVSAAPVALNAQSTGGATLTIQNTDSTNAVDLGESTVAAGAGFPLAPGVTVAVEVDPGDVLYAIRSAATDVVVAVLQT